MRSPRCVYTQYTATPVLCSFAPLQSTRPLRGWAIRTGEALREAYALLGAQAK